MKSNYKKLGEYIELVTRRNTDNYYGETDVRGVSNSKKIIGTRANNTARDFSIFYVVKPSEFIYNSRTSRMGEKVGLGFNNTTETIITSFNNTVFRVNTESLLPTYLFMWFNRPEFDRYVRFHSWGSSTEIFTWNDMCNVDIPIPNIAKQLDIVKEYNTVVNRIKLTEQLAQKLEETAKVIYKQWFVDFEFPDQNGKPYKSCCGEMIFNEELQKDIPLGWKVEGLGSIMEISSGKTPIDKNGIKNGSYTYPIYGAGGIMGYSSKSLFNEKLLSMGRVGTHGIIQRINFPCWLSDNTLILKSQFYEYLNQVLLNINYDEINRGGVQGLITQTDINNSRTLIPSKTTLIQFEKIIGRIMNYAELNKIESQKTMDLNDLLLSRLATIEN